MFRNYVKIAFRNLLRNKIFSLINIVGLATGLAICLLIMLYIFDEISYDKHHKRLSDLYRIATVTRSGDRWASQSAPLAWGLKADMPEVEQVTRLLKMPNVQKVQIKYTTGFDTRSFFEADAYYVDSTFFRMFNYDFVHGHPYSVLNQPNSIVLSETLCQKLFGKNDPVGKPVTIGLPVGEFTYTVQGVFKESGKSHIPSSIFMSMRNADFGTWIETQNNWATNNIFHTYVQLRKGTDPARFAQKVDAFYQKRAAADLKALGVSKHLFVQRVQDIYLRSNLGNEIGSNGNFQYLYILGSIAAFILFIACINFMNLSTARSSKRAKEVGVRKVMGAEKRSLVWQFLGESFLLCLAALVLAMLLASVSLPLFNRLTHKDLYSFAQPSLIAWLAVLTIITGLLSGLYPAFYLSSFKPALVLKGKMRNGFSAAAIRKGLVVLQFTISVTLILGAVVIGQQLRFLKKQDLGFKTGRQVVLPMSNKLVAKNFTVLKNELLRNRNIQTVTSGSSYPGVPIINDMLFYAAGKSTKDLIDIHLAAIENDYFETLGMQLLYGRAFTKEFTADSQAIVLNEQAVKQLGYEPADAVGKKIHYDWQGAHHTLEITGVVKDFNYESLHQPIKPFGFTTTNFFANKYMYAIVRSNTADHAALLTDIEEKWNRVNPGAPFEYSFLDQDFQRNYEKEQRTSSIVIYFTCFAIFIACLGLFGLASFSAEQRTKEIGVRKVLGASVSRIAVLLSKDFIGLVMIAISIASPIAWYGMTRWLQNFAYKVNISWWMFAAAGVAAILIALITVSMQSIKAAVANPVNSLRSE